MSDAALIEKGATAYRHGHPDDGSDADDAVNRDVARVLTAVLPEYRAQVIRECAEAMRRDSAAMESDGAEPAYVKAMTDAANMLDRMAEEPA